MKEITPYSGINQALKELDNGGRFYNIFTKADDGVIDKAELGKVGGVFNDQQKMILFLDLALSKVSLYEQQNILDRLAPGLKNAYEKYKPQELSPLKAEQKGVLSTNAIIKGIPVMVDSKTEFNGFILIPIMAGKVMTFTMIPIMDQYDVYQIRDHESDTEFFVAHARGDMKLPEKTVKIAGVIKECKASTEKNATTKKFLEAIYFTNEH